MVSRVRVSFRQFSKFLAYVWRLVAIWHLLHIVNCTAPLVPMHRLIYLLLALYAMRTGQPCTQPLPYNIGVDTNSKVLGVHTCKLVKTRCTRDITKYFFKQGH